MVDACLHRRVFCFFTFFLDKKSNKKIKPAKRDDYLRLMISLPDGRQGILSLRHL
jgi:hypothetical protein